MVAFPRAVIVFCNLIHCFATFSLTFPSSLLKLSNVEDSTTSTQTVELKIILQVNYTIITPLLSPSDESVLLDLKHLLLEAKQKVPPVLAALQADADQLIDIGGVLLTSGLWLHLDNSLKLSSAFKSARKVFEIGAFAQTS